jgi:hypothetical protein
VNLSAFETFFSERRPFFIEGLGQLAVRARCPECNGLFYSRRVGRAPHGTDNLPSGDNVYTDVPVNPRFWARRSSRPRRQIRDRRDGSGAAEGVGDRVRRSLDVPAAGGAAHELHRRPRAAEFRNQSSFGGVFTAANRQLDTLTFLPGSAYAGGIDWGLALQVVLQPRRQPHCEPRQRTAEAIDQLQENSRHYYQRPDATSFDLDATRTSLSGTAGRFAFSKIGGQRVRFNSNMTFKSPGFDVNEVGILPPSGHDQYRELLQIRSDVPTKRFRNRNINFNYFSSWNYDGNQLGRGWNVNANVTWINNWEMGGGYGGDEPGFDDRLTRGGPIGRTNRFQIGWMWLNSDRRKPVSINTFFGRGGDGQGSGFRDFNPELTFRPSTAINVTAGVRFNATQRTRSGSPTSPIQRIATSSGTSTKQRWR